MSQPRHPKGTQSAGQKTGGWFAPKPEPAVVAGAPLCLEQQEQPTEPTKTDARRTYPGRLLLHEHTPLIRDRASELWWSQQPEPSETDQRAIDAAAASDDPAELDELADHPNSAVVLAVLSNPRMSTETTTRTMRRIVELMVCDGTAFGDNDAPTPESKVLCDSVMRCFRKGFAHPNHDSDEYRGVFSGIDHKVLDARINRVIWLSDSAAAVMIPAAIEALISEGQIPAGCEDEAKRRVEEQLARYETASQPPDDDGAAEQPPWFVGL